LSLENQFFDDVDGFFFLALFVFWNQNQFVAIDATLALTSSAASVKPFLMAIAVFCGRYRSVQQPVPI